MPNRGGSLASSDDYLLRRLQERITTWMNQEAIQHVHFRPSLSDAGERVVYQVEQANQANQSLRSEDDCVWPRTAHLSSRLKWEGEFEEDNPFHDFQPIVEFDLGSKRIDVGDREERMAARLELREIAELLPPGILGLHMKGEETTNLVFRPDDDPRRRMLRGSGWFPVKKYPSVWFAAPTLENYMVLRDTGMEYKLSPRAYEWLKKRTSTEFSLSYETILNSSPLFDYQKEAVRFLFRRDRAMLSLSPGLGKTLTSAYAAGLRNFPRVLLVCPASLLHYWRAELEKWGPSLPKKPIAEIWHKEVKRPPTLLEGGKQFWAITNPETVKKYIECLTNMSPKWDLMIADESIMYKHRNSQRSDALYDLAQVVPSTWLLTGAPATRYLDDMWHQFHILDSRGYPSYWRFAERYCHVEVTPWAKTIIANRRDAEERVKENFADVYFSRSQEQVADIPDWLMEDIDIPMMPEQDKAYMRLRKELKIFIGDRDAQEVIQVHDRLSLVLRSLQIASNPVLVGGRNSSGKWNALFDLLPLYPGPYIVWINFVRTGEMLLEAFKETNISLPGKSEGMKIPRACLVNGSTPMAERQKKVEDFQNGKYDVIIMNNSVGKFGFTLTKARTAFFVERAYDDSYFQCLFRNRRIGTTQSPIVVNMRSVTQIGKRTIDHVVHDALDYRNKMIKQLTIGDLRGILDE